MDFVKQAKSRIQEVDINTAEDLMNQGWKILDVREPDEYLSGSIANAIHVPRGILEPACDLENKGGVQALQEGRNDKWLVLCRTSGRAALACDVMQQMGFTEVKNILGGMMAWQAAGKTKVIPSDAQSLVQLKQPCILD